MAAALPRSDRSKTSSTEIMVNTIETIMMEDWSLTVTEWEACLIIFVCLPLFCKIWKDVFKQVLHDLLQFGFYTFV